jgi:predicted helicase
MFNGRINLMQGDSETNTNPFQLWTETKQNGHFQNSALKNIIHTDQLSDLFFSQKNIDALQQGIRYSVYRRSNGKHVIGNQSVSELQVVMRSIFLQNAKHLPYDVVGQVKEMNALVISYCVDNILSEINLYMKYRQDVSTLPVPLDRSVNTSSAGTKTLFLKEL